MTTGRGSFPSQMHQSARYKSITANEIQFISTTFIIHVRYNINDHMFKVNDILGVIQYKLCELVIELTYFLSKCIFSTGKILICEHHQRKLYFRPEKAQTAKICS